MTDVQRPLPLWLLIISGLFALLELLGSVLLCFSPESLAETVDLNARGANYLIYMWASRQFALGIILSFATIKRSASMLTLAYLFLLVMFAGDFFIGIWQKENSLMGSALVMCIISLAMIIAVNRRKN